MAEEVSTQQVMELREAHSPSNLKIQYKASWNGGLHMVQGQGSRLYTADGDEYLDCVNNVALIGHCHPKYVASVSQQLATLNTNTRYLAAGLGTYTSRLAATMPDELEVVFMVTSGSEANDLALRLVRNAPHSESNKKKREGRGTTPHIAVFGSAYHGHTLGTLGISPYKFEGRGGFRCPPPTHIIPCADLYRGTGLDGKAAARAAMEDAARAGGYIAAFFFEPMPSCGGQLVFPSGFLKDLCDELREGGALLVADEVQTGFGRVGSHFWAFQAEGVTPDIVTIGKGIGNGFPMGAVATSKRIAQGFANGMEYFNTYGGCNAACAAGLAVLDAIRDEGLQANAKNVGEQLLKGFSALVEESPVVGDGRGAGLFLGLEFVMDSGAKVPAPHVADWVVSACLARHSVLLSTDGPCENVIKVKPPMCFSAEDAEELLAALRDIVLEQLPPRLPQLLELDRLAAEARASADALRLKIEEALRGGGGALPTAAPAAAAARVMPESQPAEAASAASPLRSAAADAATPAAAAEMEASSTTAAAAAAAAPLPPPEASAEAPAKVLPNGDAHVNDDVVPWKAMASSPVLAAAGVGILAGLGMGALLSYAARRR